MNLIHLPDLRVSTQRRGGAETGKVPTSQHPETETAVAAQMRELEIESMILVATLLHRIYIEDPNLQLVDATTGKVLHTICVRERNMLFETKVIVSFVCLIMCLVSLNENTKRSAISGECVGIR